MTFRKIAFIFIALLLSLLFLLQFWLIQNFTKDVSSKIGEAAFEVSRSTVETIVFQQPKLEFKHIALSTKISEKAQIELINSLSHTPDDIHISLNDGQLDDFLTIRSDGENYKVDIPRTGIQKSLDSMSTKILMSAFAFILIGLIVASYFSRRFAQPLVDLQIASEHIGRGDFGFQVKNEDKAQSIELRNTMQAFNEMSYQIKQLQKENEILQKQAQLSELAEITRGLAHTIRNPLNTLTLAIDQLASKSTDESRKEMVRISKHQVQRIDSWVRSLMDVMSNDTSLIEETNVQQLLRSCIDDISLNNTSSVVTKLVIDQGSEEDQVFTIQTISPEIKSLLQGLISNAIEATDSAHQLKANSNELPPVIVTLSNFEGAIAISITDEGTGISDEIKAKLFSPHNTNKTYGAGMGLYLAHRIITIKYNGTLDISDASQLKKGAVSGCCVNLTLNNRV